MFNRKTGLVAALVVGVSTLVAGVEARAAEFTVDGAHSSVGFKIKSKETYYVNGLFGQVSGTISTGEKAKFDLVVKAESITTGNEGRDKHLRSPDFFNVKQFPDIKFVSKEVKAKGDGFEVSGEITLLGVTKPVKVEINKVGHGKGQKGEEIVGYEASFEVDRSEFGMKYGAGMVENKVKLTVDIAATAK